MRKKRIEDRRTDEQIVSEIQEGINLEENQLRLWSRVENLAKKVIKLYCGPMCIEAANYEDFMQQCFLGMLEAAAKYKQKEEYGTSFKTFVFIYFRLYLLSYNGSSYSSIRIPYRARKRVDKYQKFKEEYKKAHNGKEPGREAVIKGMNLRKQDYVPLMNLVSGLEEISKEEYLTPEGFSIEDVLASDERFEDYVCSSVYLKELHEALEDALSIMTEKRASMVKMLYYSGRSYKDVSAAFNISLQSVKNSVRAGFNSVLLNPYMRKRLESFMYEGYHYDIDGLYRRLDKRRDYENELYARKHGKTETHKEE